jgi:hypothetical protein
MIIPRRHHGRIPGLIDQHDYALQQGIECVRR